MACSLVAPSEKPSVSLFVFHIDGGQEIVCHQCCYIHSRVHGVTRQQTIAIIVMTSEPQLSTML
jgi:hypothetical protein